MTLKTLFGIVALVVAGLSPALAHLGTVGHEHGFGMGFAHPLSGLDHVLAMLAIGLWAGSVGQSARWVWPLTFVAVAGFAALIGQKGYQLMAIEPLVASSVILLGAFVYLGLRLPVLAGMVLCAASAFVHGYAHGLEMADDLDGGSFIAGFLLATALLHALGLMLSIRLNDMAGRMAGGLITLIGSYLLAMVV